MKLLTFSWVVYSDSTPPSAEKDIHIEIKGLQSEKHQSVVPVTEVTIPMLVMRARQLLSSSDTASLGHIAG